jgi:DNA topoisomerase IB-like protein
MTDWLDENCGADGWAMTPSGTRGVFNDAVWIYFLTRPPAGAFVARWCTSGRLCELFAEDFVPQGRDLPHPGQHRSRDAHHDRGRTKHLGGPDRPHLSAAAPSHGGCGTRPRARVLAEVQYAHVRAERVELKTWKKATDAALKAAPAAFQAPLDPVAAAKLAKLRHVSDDMPGITRHKARSGFDYRYPDGELVGDIETLKRIRSLAIPPAWTAVWICPYPNGHIQATGRDNRGRKQYR